MIRVQGAGAYKVRVTPLRTAKLALNGGQK